MMEDSANTMNPPAALPGSKPAATTQLLDEPASRDRGGAFVYAIGRDLPRFPSLGGEKEFAQASGSTARAPDLNDQELLVSVLRANRYIARQICWVFIIEGLETYILVPRDPADLDLLLQALRPTPSPIDIDVVIGVRGPVA